ncbi:MAG TPA: bacillithiol system redox-active protein YtxJ [Vicinamibacterales bacterium]|nr:bacillithiol system redox-active protein YtxJ [Vicinamibacterales bacterium]
MPPLTPLETVADLDGALAGSATRPILIFKHSATCGTSGVALEEIEELVELLDEEALPVDVFVVGVQAARAVSNEIETRMRVRHESPQVLLISNGQVVWRASHFRVTAKAMTAALRQHIPQGQLSR